MIANTALERCERLQRAQRALALASLLARGAREAAYVVDRDLGDEVNNGLAYIEDDLLEELADLLGLRPKPPPP